MIDESVIIFDVKEYPFEVRINLKEISGVVLADHVKKLDWVKRKASFITKAPANVIDEVIMFINAIIQQ